MGNSCEQCWYQFGSQLSSLQEEEARRAREAWRARFRQKNFLASLKKVESFSKKGIPETALQTIAKMGGNELSLMSCLQLIEPYRGYIIINDTQQEPIPNPPLAKENPPLGLLVMVYLFNAANQFEKYYEGRIFGLEAHDDHALCVYPNGAYYQGALRKNKAHGNGAYIDNTANGRGYHYEGNWLQDLPDGVGKQTIDLIIYDGEFKRGEKSGKGKIRFEDLYLYEGQWSQNLPQGKGLLCIQGVREEYQGNFIKGLLQGKGSWSNQKGEKYEGHFKDGIKDGYGTLTFSDKSYYAGQFSLGLPHGKGCILNKNVKTQGYWHQGKLIEQVPEEEIKIETEREEKGEVEGQEKGNRSQESRLSSNPVN